MCSRLARPVAGLRVRPYAAIANGLVGFAVAAIPLTTFSAEFRRGVLHAALQLQILHQHHLSDGWLSYPQLN